MHYAVNLGDLQCDFFQLTENRQSAETFRRVSVKAGDILLGDRVYAAPPGVAYVLGSGGDVIVRLNRQVLPIYDFRHRRIDLAARMRKLPGHSPTEYLAWVKGPQGNWIAGRVVALRQSVEVMCWGRKRMLRRAQRDQQTVSPLSLELAVYFMLWTSLQELGAAEVVELYRLRWQIEMVFKRMKSILGLGRLPKRDPLGAQAWRVRRLEGRCYEFVYLDRANFQVRINRHVGRQHFCAVLGVSEEGECFEVLALEMGDRERSELRESIFLILTEQGLNREVVELRVMNGLPGVEAAFRRSFPRARTQRCQKHAKANARRRVRKREREEFSKEVNKIFSAANEAAAPTAFFALQDR